jgi:hypothetical protein
MNDSTIRAEDVVGVRTRISWGAIFAGATIALAVYLVLTLLGSAIGLSIRDNVRAENLGTGAAIWAIVSTILALFLGGWVTSQCTVGENQSEAVVHGIIMWGTLFAMMLWLVASGVRSGFTAMVGMANVTANSAATLSNEGWEVAARRAGVSQEQIDQWRAQASNTARDARQALQNPQNQEAAAETATKAAWWTLVGILLSMASAVAGALVGAGPTPRFFGTVANFTHTRVTTTQEPARHL